MEKRSLNISKIEWDKFLIDLQKRIRDEKFQLSLDKMMKIDDKYYDENITPNELIKIIDEYREKDVQDVENMENIQILLSGNPEIVFRLGIEAVRNNVKMILNIEDFCLAQNTILVDTINSIAEENNLYTRLILQNLVKDEKIYEISQRVDCTICFGNSNDYNRLNRKYKIKDLRLYPYNILELYMDSFDLEEVRIGVYEYTIRNQFQMEIYDMDLDIEDVINDMNNNGYGFCSILFSKDKEKIRKFKDNVKSKYVCVNENPFKKIKWEFDLMKNHK